MHVRKVNSVYCLFFSVSLHALLFAFNMACMCLIVLLAKISVFKTVVAKLQIFLYCSCRENYSFKILIFSINRIQLLRFLYKKNMTKCVYFVTHFFNQFTEFRSESIVLSFKNTLIRSVSFHLNKQSRNCDQISFDSLISFCTHSN